jgi:hypothetical protein
MAYLDDTKKQQGDVTGQDPTQAQVPGGGGGGDVGGGGQTGTGGVSTAGIGAGGQGNWTNIQAYLQANQGDNGSAKNLTDKAESQFGQEKQNMQDQSGQFLKGAQDQVAKSSIDSTQADKMIGDAATNYDYGGNQNQQYKDTASRMQSALNDQYSGPTSYSYNLSAPTQNYGDNLGNEAGFKNMMTNLYSEKAGSPLSTGQATLQSQFDANNSALNQARQKELGSYGNLQQQQNKTNTDASNQLGQDQKQYMTNQNNLKSYLGGQTGALDTSINKQQEDAKQAYQNTFTGAANGVTSLQNNIADQIDKTYGNNGYQGDNAFYGVDKYVGGPGSVGGAPTWKGVSDYLGDGHSGINQNQLYNQEYYQHVGDQGGAGNPQTRVDQIMPSLNAMEQGYKTDATNRLNDFYKQQDDKYAGTADTDKRKYNAIQDFLGSTTKKTAGFKERT